jgi:hypothetical protein
MSWKTYMEYIISVDWRVYKCLLIYAFEQKYLTSVIVVFICVFQILK